MEVVPIAKYYMFYRVRAPCFVWTVRYIQNVMLVKMINGRSGMTMINGGKTDG